MFLAVLAVTELWQNYPLCATFFAHVVAYKDK